MAVAENDRARLLALLQDISVHSSAESLTALDSAIESSFFEFLPGLSGGGTPALPGLGGGIPGLPGIGGGGGMSGMMNNLVSVPKNLMSKLPPFNISNVVTVPVNIMKKLFGPMLNSHKDRRRKADSSGSCESKDPLDTNDPDCFAARFSMLVSYYGVDTKLKKLDRQVVQGASEAEGLVGSIITTAGRSEKIIFGSAGSGLITDSETLTSAAKQLQQASVASTDALYSEMMKATDTSINDVRELKLVLTDGLNNLTASVDQVAKKQATVAAVRASQLTTQASKVLRADVATVQQVTVDVGNVIGASARSLADSVDSIDPRISKVASKLDDGEDLLDSAKTGIKRATADANRSLADSLSQSTQRLSTNSIQALTKAETTMNQIVADVSSLSAQAEREFLIDTTNVASEIKNSTVRSVKRSNNFAETRLLVEAPEMIDRTQRRTSKVLDDALKSVSNKTREADLVWSDLQSMGKTEQARVESQTADVGIVASTEPRALEKAVVDSQRFALKSLNSVAVDQRAALARMADTVVSTGKAAVRDVVHFESNRVDDLVAIGNDATAMEGSINAAIRSTNNAIQSMTRKNDAELVRNQIGFETDSSRNASFLMQRLTDVSSQMVRTSEELGRLMNGSAKSVNETLQTQLHATTHALSDAGNFFIAQFNQTLAAVQEAAADVKLTDSHRGAAALTSSQSAVTNDLKSLSLMFQRISSSQQEGMVNVSLKLQRFSAEAAQRLATAADQGIAGISAVQADLMAIADPVRAVISDSVSRLNMSSREDTLANALTITKVQENRIKALMNQLGIVNNSIPDMSHAQDRVSALFKEGMDGVSDMEVTLPPWESVTSDSLRVLTDVTNQTVRPLLANLRTVREAVDSLDSITDNFTVGLLSTRSDLAIMQSASAADRRDTTSRLEQIITGLANSKQRNAMHASVTGLEMLKMETALHWKKIRSAVESELFEIPILIQNAFTDIVPLRMNISTLRPRNSEGQRSAVVNAKLERLQESVLQGLTRLQNHIDSVRVLQEHDIANSVSAVDVFTQTLANAKRSLGLPLDDSIDSALFGVGQVAPAVTLLVNETVSSLAAHVATASLEAIGNSHKSELNKLLDSAGVAVAKLSQSASNRGNVTDQLANALSRTIRTISNITDFAKTAFDAHHPLWRFHERVSDFNGESTKALLDVLDQPWFEDMTNVARFYRDIDEVLNQLNVSLTPSSEFALNRFTRTVQQEMARQDKFESDWHTNTI